MHVIHAAFKIGIIPNLMLPKPRLPNTRFTPRNPRRTQSRVLPEFGQGFAAQLLDHVPTQAEISVIFRQRPNGVKMVRQQHPSINRERMVASGTVDCFAQGSTKHRLEQDRLALMRDDREKERPARGLDTAVIGHGSSIDGFTCGALKSAPYGNFCQYFQMFLNPGQVQNTFERRICAILTKISSIKNLVGCALERTVLNPTNLERTTTTFNFHMFAFFQVLQTLPPPSLVQG
jgi:hypothetical protein